MTGKLSLEYCQIALDINASKGLEEITQLHSDTLATEDIPYQYNRWYSKI